jgi:hypothetical protein
MTRLVIAMDGTELWHTLISSSSHGGMRRPQRHAGGSRHGEYVFFPACFGFVSHYDQSFLDECELSFAAP